ncbi:MAG TPA: hypothetical protein VIJ38_08730, partial [Acidobacteriaceae bacterium]
GTLRWWEVIWAFGEAVHPTFGNQMRNGNLAYSNRVERKIGLDRGRRRRERTRFAPKKLPQFKAKRTSQKALGPQGGNALKRTIYIMLSNDVP